MAYQSTIINECATGFEKRSLIEIPIPAFFAIARGFQIVVAHNTIFSVDENRLIINAHNGLLLSSERIIRRIQQTLLKEGHCFLGSIVHLIEFQIAEGGLFKDQK